MPSTLSKKTKVYYGAGSAAWAAKDACFQFFLFFYYSQILGLSASLAGLAALLALIADGISDPIIGHLSDRWKSKKWGRRHPFMMWSVVPFCLGVFAIFNPPAELSQWQLFSWYLIMAILVRTSLTFFTVPHMALGAELSDSYHERTSIAVYRTVLGFFCGLLIQVVAWFVLIPHATAQGDLASGYVSTGVFAITVAFVGMLMAILGSKSRIPYLHQIGDEQSHRPWYSAFSDLIGLMKVDSSKIFLLANLVIATAIGISNTMLIHVNNFYYGFSSEQMGIFMLCIAFALPFASLLSVKVSRAMGKTRAIVLFLIITALIGPIPVLLHLYGFLPETGSNQLLLVVCIFVVLSQSFYIAHANILGAMVPDIADDLASQNGMRQEGILNSAMMLTQKVTFGVGTFMAGLMIDFAGFDGVESASEVSHDMMLKLGWMYGPGIAILVLVGAWVYSKYSLSPERYMAIRQQLDGSISRQL